MKITKVYGIIVILIIYMVYKCYSVLKLKHPCSYKTSKHSLFSEVVSWSSPSYSSSSSSMLTRTCLSSIPGGSTPWFLPLQVTGSLH